MTPQNELSLRHKTNWWVAYTNRTGQPAPSTNQPLTRRAPAGENAGARHPLPTGEGCCVAWGRGVRPATALSTSRRGSGEGSLHCHTHPAQNTENSRNELHDLLQSKGLTTNDPSKRTGHSAQNERVSAHLCVLDHRRRSGRAPSRPHKGVCTRHPRPGSSALPLLPGTRQLGAMAAH